jgi:ribosomal protein S15P/S13E
MAHGMECKLVSTLITIQMLLLTRAATKLRVHCKQITNDSDTKMYAFTFTCN